MTINFHTMAGAATFALLSLNACAQAPASHPGPFLPPELRSPAPLKPSSGQALQEQAMDKLRKSFEQADLDADRSLTREEAKRAGLGFVEAHFDAIDSAGKGKVSFDDVRQFMARRSK